MDSPPQLFNLVLDELDIAIESQDSVFKVIMLGLAKRVREICEDESEKVSDKFCIFSTRLIKSDA